MNKFNRDERGKFTETQETARKPVSWIKRIGRRIKAFLYYQAITRPKNWIARQWYKVRRNRVAQTFAFFALVPGGVWIFAGFAHYQLGWQPEIQALFAKEEEVIQEQKEAQQDRLTQASKDLEDAEAKKKKALAVIEEVKKELKILDDEQLKHQLGLK